MMTIEEVACEAFGANLCEMLNGSRERQCVEARYFSIYWRRKHKKQTTFEIGKIYGRDHSTVTNAEKALATWLEVDKVFKGKFEIAYNKLQNGEQ
jgi:chromosomal replication initiation ATPase DnaA